MRRTIAAAGLMTLALLTVGGCADKIGQRVAGSALSADDPSNTSSSAILRDSGGSIVTGKNTVETSLIQDNLMQETNSGGVAKQRVAFQLPVRIQGFSEKWLTQVSAASNINIGKIDVVFAEDGSPKSLVIENFTTDNASVQKALNEAVASEVAAFLKGTEAERDVQIKRLDTQAQAAGFAADVAKTAIPLLKLLAGGVP